MKDHEMDHLLSNISDFFAGRSIFITGGTGFLGKVLIEKLLRSCSDIKEIFLLMRPKKGINVEQRVQEIWSGPLYEELRKTDPSAIAKIIPVKGDAAKEGLGLDPVDREMLIDRVSVIFHNAASVRFDDNLKYAIFINTRSTREICVLASGMKKFVVLLHVSSTYTNSDKSVIEEIVYPSGIDWRKTIKVAESLDDDMLKAFTAKYMGPVPNTYIFTKRLAEDVINEYSDRLPCVIFRPSIVVPTYNDPIEGWLDNFNGPTGLLVGGGKGLVRIVYANKNMRPDYIPVDITIKVMIMVSCLRGRIPITKDPSPHVYNCASQELTKITYQQLVEHAIEVNKDVPLDNCIWRPIGCFTQSLIYFHINVLLFQLLPALILDMILKFKGHQPMLAKLQRKIYVTNKSLAYFVNNSWAFRNDKLLPLLFKLSGDDAKKFFFPTSIDVEEFTKISLIGAKKYLLHEDMNQVKKAKQHLKRITWADRICKSLFVVLIVWVLYKAEFFGNMWNRIGESLNFV